MSHETVIGWDVGGAHVKAACLSTSGNVLAVKQVACPLWQGGDHLGHAVRKVMATFPGGHAVHAVTMTGELVDLFESRVEGVRFIVERLSALLSPARPRIFAGSEGFVEPPLAPTVEHLVASSNWLASATLVARRLPAGVFIDVGSTTTDIIVFKGGKPTVCGSTDHARLCSGELVYTGVVRTPLMAVASGVHYEGSWVPLMAEHFATMADVYRVTGELPAHADLHPTSDGRPKTVHASVRRIARMLGLDLEDGRDLDCWGEVARRFSAMQLALIGSACARVLDHHTLAADAPLVGAGVGRFLVRHLAQRMRRSYLEFQSFIDVGMLSAGDVSDCAPAVAVAGLALEDTG